MADEDNLEKATERLSDEERSLGTSEQYTATVEKVTEEEINFRCRIRSSHDFQADEQRTILEYGLYKDVGCV